MKVEGEKMLKPGLYEQIIDSAMGVSLDQPQVQDEFFIDKAAIDKAEASGLLAKYVSEIVQKGLDNLKDNGGDIQRQIAFVNKIIGEIFKETGDSDFKNMSVDKRANNSWFLWKRKIAFCL